MGGSRRSHHSHLVPSGWILRGFHGAIEKMRRSFHRPIRDIGDGPIVIPESQEANICINFPPVPERNLKGGWRHDRGEKGACTSGCCDFQPPTSKKVEKIHPTWFETKSDCSESSGAVTGPIYFHGAERQEKTLCIQINADGEFAVHRGELGTCRYGCCIFYGGRE